MLCFGNSLNAKVEWANDKSIVDQLHKCLWIAFRKVPYELQVSHSGEGSRSEFGDMVR